MNMKCTLVIDPTREEELVLYVHEKHTLAQRLEALATEGEREWIGYREGEAVRFSPEDVICFFVEDGKVWARMPREVLRVRERLYVLEPRLEDTFVKIHQSCIANIKQMKRFDTSMAGTLLVTFQNGHREYVSRRQLKIVKERIGIFR